MCEREGWGLRDIAFVIQNLQEVRSYSGSRPKVQDDVGGGDSRTVVETLRRDSRGLSSRGMNGGGRSLGPEIVSAEHTLIVSQFYTIAHLKNRHQLI